MRLCGAQISLPFCIGSAELESDISANNFTFTISEFEKILNIRIQYLQNKPNFKNNN